MMPVAFSSSEVYLLYCRSAAQLGDGTCGIGAAAGCQAQAGATRDSGLGSRAERAH